MKSAPVERRYKLKAALIICVLTLAGAAVLTSFFYFAASKSLVGSYVEAVHAIRDLKINILPFLFSSFHPVSILALVTDAIAVVSVFLSHRIVGPVYRPEKNPGIGRPCRPYELQGEWPARGSR